MINQRSISFKNQNNKSDLDLALQNRNYQIIEELFKYEKQFTDVGRYILDAVNEQNIKFARLLIQYANENKIEWDHWQVKGDSAIHCAVKQKNLNMLKLIIAGKANLDQKNESGETALDFAFKNKNKKIIKELLNHLTHFEKIGLHILEAVKENDAVLTNKLIKYANEYNIAWDHWKQDGDTALKHAVINDNYHMVKLLLQGKANPDIKDGELKTVLEIALENSYDRIRDLLFSHVKTFEHVGSYLFNALNGDEFELSEKLIKYAHDNHQNLNHWRDRETGNTLLHAAVRTLNIDIVRLLKGNGADIYATNLENESILDLAIGSEGDENFSEILEEVLGYDLTAAQLCQGIVTAAKKNNIQILIDLLARTAKVDNFGVNHSDRLGNSALYYAITHQNHEMVRLLLKHGADINQKNKAGNTPFHTVLSIRSNAILTEIFSQGKTVENVGDYIVTAARMDWMPLVIKLLELAKDQKQDWSTWGNADHNSALHLAILNNNHRMAKLLIDNKADLKKKNNKAQTALHLALETKNNRIISELVEHIEKIQDVGDYILKAAQYNNCEIVKELLLYASEDKQGWETWCNSENGNSAIHYAVINNNLDMVKALTAAGVNIHKKNQAGETPLAIAAKHNNPALLAHLCLYFSEIDFEKLIKTSDVDFVSDLYHFDINQLTAATSQKIIEITREKLASLAEQKRPDVEIQRIHELNHNMGIFYDSMFFKKAVIANDFATVKKLLNPDLLNKPLGTEKMTALEIAILHNKKEIADYLLLHGGKLKHIVEGSPDIYRSLATYKTGESLVEESLGKLINRLATSLSNTGITVDNDLAVIKHSLSAPIATLLNDFPSLRDKLTFNEKMDLTILITGLINAVQQVKTRAQFCEQVQAILMAREDAILNSSMDYCYATHSAVNQLCHTLASMLFPSASAPNKLLQNACTKGRKNIPWFDPGVGVEETTLPEFTKFFRLPGNEIHIYQYVVNQAIARVKDNNRLLEHIWFGTDPKNITPVPPLSYETLSLLKQKSPTLRKLIEYTERLDEFTRAIAANDAYTQFSLLEKGLLAGNYKSHDGSHQQAGSAANVAIAKFGEWWNSLNKVHPDLCEKIKGLKHTHQNVEEKIGDVINILFDQSHVAVGDNERRDNAIYCVHLKANMIERLMSNRSIADTLKGIKLDRIVDQPFNFVPPSELDHWEAKINQEIEQHSVPMLVNGHGKFPNQLLTIELNSLFINNGFIKSYSDIFISNNRATDTQYFIRYIFSEKDNAQLLKLREILSRPDFNYLRDHNYNSQYYAMFQGQRRQTSEHYALIQKAMAEQMIQNVTFDKTSKQSAQTAIQQLCEKNPFIKCQTTQSRFSFFASNDVSTVFNGIWTFKGCQETLRNKITKLKEQALKL